MYCTPLLHKPIYKLMMNSPLNWKEWLLEWVLSKVKCFDMVLQCNVSPCRFHNKGVYVKVGLQKLSHTRNLYKDLKLQVDKQEVELPNIEGLIFLNIPRLLGNSHTYTLIHTSKCTYLHICIYKGNCVCVWQQCWSVSSVQLGLWSRLVGLRQWHALWEAPYRWWNVGGGWRDWGGAHGESYPSSTVRSSTSALLSVAVIFLLQITTAPPSG